MAEIDEIRALSDSDLQSNLDSIQEELMNMRFRVATMQMTNVNEIKLAKKRIAKIKTVISVLGKKINTKNSKARKVYRITRRFFLDLRSPK